MLIEIAKITADSLVQPRETLNKEKLTEYGKILLNGEDLDPVDLYFDRSIYWLADGFHRLEVYRLAGKTHIPATVTEGTRRDAILFGIERNAKHGLGLSLKERKNAAHRLLLDPEWSQWSNRLIGRICGLNHETISTIKKNLNSHQSIPVENPSGDFRQIQNFTNPSDSDLDSENPELLQSVSGDFRQIQNSTNAPTNQASIRKAKRSGREYTIDTSSIGRNSSRKNTPHPKDQTVDITSTTQTVYDFFLPASDTSPNNFRILLASYDSPLFSDDKLELSLKLFLAGPTFALPLILDQMVACPKFAQFVFNQAQELAAQANSST
jgi:ParB-like nuclease domain